MPRHYYGLLALGVAIVAFLIPGMLVAPTPGVAMPTFAQAYGLQCSACHTQVPLLNAYGRYVQRTAYSALDRTVLKRAIPLWIGEAGNYDSTAGKASGTNQNSFGNLALHGGGYLSPDLTFHAQQWISQGDQSGGVDTLWAAYSNFFHHEGHLFVGKLVNPVPSPYGMDFELDGIGALGTVVGEHSWGATYNNRWGTKFNYVHKALDLEAGYFLSADDLNGISDFGVRRDTTQNPPVLTAGDKTFQWKIAYARVDVPVEFGVFGSNGALPLSATTGTDVYHSVAGFVQVDPDRRGRPGMLAVYQTGRDGNPGIDANTGNVLPSTTSRGASLFVYEPILRGGATVGIRHDINDNGYGTVGNGNAINLAFNIPRFSYAHGFVEVNLGGNSALAGASGGPTWKGMFWLTLPIKGVK